jgi:hypothetical protein
MKHNYHNLFYAVMDWRKVSIMTPLDGQGNFNDIVHMKSTKYKKSYKIKNIVH